MPTTTIPPRDAVERLAAVLDAILGELRGIRAALDRRPTPGTVSRADRTCLARLLPAIAGARGSEPFTARELFEADTAPGVRLVVRGLNAKRVGRLFARAESVAVEGLVVERHGLELNTVVWRVVARNANVSVPPRPSPIAV